MQEEKVRKAFNVANELSQKSSDGVQVVAFARVFDAMLQHDIPFMPTNMTATGASVVKEYRDGGENN